MTDDQIARAVAEILAREGAEVGLESVSDIVAEAELVGDPVPDWWKTSPERAVAAVLAVEL